MSILPNCAISCVTPAFRISGFPKRFAGSTPSPFSPPANWISKNARDLQPETSPNPNEQIISFARKSHSRNLYEAALRLRIARAYVAAGKCKLRRRVSSGSESYQPFRSPHHFVSSATKNRLDGDG